MRDDEMREGEGVTCIHRWLCAQDGSARCVRCGEERQMITYLDGRLNSRGWVSQEKDPAAFMRRRLR